jgi:hypothetical protein
MKNLNSYKELCSLPNWQVFVASAVKNLKPYAKSHSGEPNDEVVTFNRKAIVALIPSLPYVVHKTGIEEVHIIVNRNYKPIGVNTNLCADYDLFPHAQLNDTELKLLTPYFYLKQTSRISGVFYDDGCDPTQSEIHTRNLRDRLVKVLAAQQKTTAKKIEAWLR